MKLLAFDTAMAACSVAVIDTAHALPLAARYVPMEKGHAEGLAPMVERAMDEAGLSFTQLERIAVTIGPGTFTGVRIGLSLARGFGVSLGIPVIGIDTLSAIAANVTEEDAPILAAADARKNEVYAALFDEGRRIVRKPAVVPLIEAINDVPDGTIVIGTAADQLSQIHAGLVRSRSGDLPVAANFARLATNLPAPPSPPAPLYLRQPDARPQPGQRRLNIRGATPADATILSAIHAECFDRAWDAQSLATLMAMPGAVSWLASDGEAPLAFILARRAADEAEIITIATRPSSRRRGFARRLVEECAQHLKQDGIARLFLEAASGNEAARALYTSLGFTEAGARRAYYGKGEDAVVMVKTL